MINELSKQTKLLIFLAFFCGTFFLPVDVLAATRYVNANSSGAATNPTRAFNDPSYVANDSYATLDTAYTAASTGDIIEVSGGPSGQSYVGLLAGTVAKAITIRGSSISGYDGEVIVDYNPSMVSTKKYTVTITVNGVTLENITFKRSNSTAVASTTDFIIDIYNSNTVLNDITLKDSAGGGINIRSSATSGLVFNNLIIDQSTINGLVSNTSGGPIIQAYAGFTANKCLVYGKGSSSNGMVLRQNAGTFVFNNCTFNNSYAHVVKTYSGNTITFNNSTFTANSIYDTNVGIFYFFQSATINTNNCLIQSNAYNVTQFTNGTGTWNSSNDIINDFPYYTRTKANLGYLSFFVDDYGGLDYFSSFANWLNDTYGQKMSMFMSNTDSLTADQKSILQTLYLNGHDIGDHTRNHSNLSYTDAINVKYSGVETDINFVVSASGTSLSTTGSGDTHGPVDISVYNLTGLLSEINSWSNYTAAINGSGIDIKTAMSATSLKDATTSLTQNVTTSIPFDDTNSTTNRYYGPEIGSSISDLETALNESLSIDDYTVRSFTFPMNAASATALNWVKNNTNILAVRQNSGGVTTGASQSNLSAIDLYNLTVFYGYSGLKGTGYDSLNDAEKEVRIRSSARLMATLATNGMAVGSLSHQTSELSLQEFQWLQDELHKYISDYNIGVRSLADLSDEISTSGNWTGAGGGVWTRTFSGSDDFSLRYNSPMIDAGNTTPGLTTDMLGNPIYGTPDIGGYEYQPPYVIGSNELYINVSSTRIYADGHFRNTSVTSSVDTANMSITPDGGSFGADDYAEWMNILISNWQTTSTQNKTFTASSTVATTTIFTIGDLVANKYYTIKLDGAVTSTITGSGCTNSVCLSNGSGVITYTYSGGYSTHEFTIEQDVTSPSAFTLSLPVNSATTTDQTPTLTWNASVDSESGLAEYQLFIDDVLNIDNISSSTLSTTTASTLSYGAHTWYIKAIDNNSNETTSTATFSLTILDETAPSAFTLSLPANSTSDSDKTPSLTWNASSDSGAGLSSYVIYVDSVLNTSGISSSTTSYTLTTDLACGAHTWYVKAIDVSSNETDSDTFTYTVTCATASTNPGHASIISTPPAINSIQAPANISSEVAGGSVTLNFSVNNVVQMAISDNSSFTNTSWEPYLSSVSYKLSDTSINTLYVKFRSNDGGETPVQIIALSSSENVATGPIEVDNVTTIISRYVFTKFLSYGMYNEEVKQLQIRLQDLGYLAKTITPVLNFGPATKSAVIKLQKEHKLIPPYGFVGPGTREVLNQGQENNELKEQQIITLPGNYQFTKFLSYGMRGEEVRQLQIRLKDLGYLAKTITPVLNFGPSTRSAVIELQKEHSLRPPFGYVGPGTREVLNNY